MRGVFRHTLLLAFCASSHAYGANHIDHAAEGFLGQCFRSLSAFLVAAYGEHHSDDDNVKAFPFGKDGRYHWVLDTTAQVNIARTLLRKEGRDKFCVVLQVPLASTVSLTLAEKSGNLPDEVISLDTPPPGFPARKVIYRFSPEERVYRRRDCFLVRDNAAPRPIPCETLYEEPESGHRRPRCCTPGRTVHATPIAHSRIMGGPHAAHRSTAE